VSSGQRRKSSHCNKPPPSPRTLESSAVRSLFDASGGNSPQTRRAPSSRPGLFRTLSPSYLTLIERRGFSPLTPQDTPSPLHETIAADSREGPLPEATRRSSSLLPQISRVRTVDNKEKGNRDPPTHWRPPTPFPMGTPESLTPDSRPMSPQPVTMATDAQRAWIGRLALIRARSPPQPSIDSVGIYGQMTGGEEVSKKEPCGRLHPRGRHACNDCPPPGEPHICDDCAVDPRTPSIDWIG